MVMVSMSRSKASSSAEMKRNIPQSNGTSNDKGEMKPSDTLRRQQEISMFSALARGEETTEPLNSPSPIGHDNEMTGIKVTTMTEYADIKDLDTLETKKKSDTLHRQQEINMFAALARGDDSGTFDSKSLREPNTENQNRQQEMNMFAALARGDESGTFELSVNTPLKSNASSSRSNSSIVTSSKASSGTFVNSDVSSSKSSNRNIDRNIEAALSSLETMNPLTESRSPTPSILKWQQPAPQKKPVCNQIYSECVKVSRPLFFGNNLSGSVLDEIEKIRYAKDNRSDDLHSSPTCNRSRDGTGENFLINESSSMRDMYDDFKLPFSFSCTSFDMDESIEIPTEYNNFIGALEVYGYGSARNLLLNNFTDISNGSSPYLTTYEPVWGNRARLDREERIKKQIEGFPDENKLGINLTEKQIKADDVNQSDAPVLKRADISTIASHIHQETKSNNYRGTLTTVPEKESVNAVNVDTFRRLSAVENNSGSFEGGELKTLVGQNENISKALLSLGAGDGVHSASLAAIDSTAIVAAAVAAEGLSVIKDDGTPMSNFELTNGLVPLYGCDDAPLPTGADLDNFEDDRMRALTQRQAQDLIASQAVPNVFGQIVCPSAAISPDDSQSWFPRNGIRRRMTQNLGTISSFHQRNISFDSTILDKSSLPSPPPPPPSTSQISSTIDSRSSGYHNQIEQGDRNELTSNAMPRLGWWNVSDDHGFKSQIKSESEGALNDILSPLQLPPFRDIQNIHDVVNHLPPPSEQLLKENRSLSELNPATESIAVSPYLSDRPPSTRFLQIVAQAVGFPEVGEIEPLFCSLSIWNIEGVQNSIPDISGGVTLVPNTSRCGRITESLYFDMVSDPEVEEKCKASLWPLSDVSENFISSEESKMQGTRCGVFPLPSNFNIGNLFAVLLVHKVLSDESDLEIYFKSLKSKVDDKNPVKSAAVDLAKLRSRAEKSSSRNGRILMPFAFGVAPLVHIIGSEPPNIPISRAAHIPLFKLAPGQGEITIIDHIMSIYFLKSGSKARPADITNGGMALLVMRNFGYLGMHRAIHSQSKLARDRLVDFTGEFQVRRRTKTDSRSMEKMESLDNSETNAVTSNWFTDFISERTYNGGRSSSHLQDQADGNTPEGRDKTSTSSLYAQELAPLPLFITPPNYRGQKSTSTASGVANGSISELPSFGRDAETYFHTSFCNEMILQPRLLHNCPKRNISIKFEICHMKQCEETDSLIVIPSVSPTIHNPRRGQHLVYEVFTSCAYHTIDPHFLDEFKVKLPACLTSKSQDLERTGSRLVVLLSVYNIHLKKKKWSDMISKKKPSRRNSLENDESFELDIHPEAGTDRKCAFELLGCGILPLSQSDDVSCLIQNGLHDVQLNYITKPFTHHHLERKVETSNASADNLNNYPPGTLMLMPLDLESVTNIETDAVNLNHCGERESRSFATSEKSAFTHVDSKGSASESQLTISQLHPADFGTSDAQSSSFPSTPKAKKNYEVMVLQIRTVGLSSVHPQNEVLAKFLSYLPKPPRAPSLDDLSKWNVNRDKLLSEALNIRIPSSEHDSTDEEIILLRYTTDITKSNICPTYDTTTHFLRVLFQLLRSMISGFGDPSVLWANPASTTPLRLQSFLSLLQVLSSATSFMSRSGVYQLDGKSKWNMNATGRIVSLLFDDEAISGSMHKEYTINKAESIDVDEAIKVENDKNRTLKSPHSHENDASISSKDDLNLLNISAKPPPLRNRSNSAPQKIKIDSKLDFQSALKASFDSTKTNGMLGPAGNRRRWMTLQSASLATIREDNDKIDESNDEIPVPENNKLDKTIDTTGDILDTELILHKSDPSKKVKQMRVPKVSTDEATNSSSIDQSDAPAASIAPKPQKAFPTTDEEIEAAGNAFLDVIGLSSNFGKVETKVDEERPNVSHRKTRSRCSIDWTLPAADLLIENHQLSEMRRKNPVPATKINEKATISNDSLGQNKDNPKNSLTKETLNNDTKAQDKEDIYVLPDFSTRLVNLGRNQKQGRWFPYAYEVILYQWVILLMDLTKNGGDKISDSESLIHANLKQPASITKLISDAAAKARGAIIACSPVLLGVIKKSLAHRIHSLFHSRQEYEQSSKNTSDFKFSVPTLVTLDRSIISAFEQLISMITDACIDSRNFDSYNLRQASITVNDAIVRFLRDLFSILDTTVVHRLLLIYFSRFVVKDGKHWQDRDSKIGLRCSWEVCKLRLNAITLLIRFADFVKINKPLMATSGSWPLDTSCQSNRIFFSNTLEQLQGLEMNRFSGEVPLSGNTFEIPPLQSHWLVELVIDICLAATGHLEQSIQYRASSILHELFWTSSQIGKVNGSLTVVASIYVTFILKILKHISYLSSLPPKSQLRKDLLPCAVFVLQSAPVPLMRALWRKLCKRAEGIGERNYGGIAGLKGLIQKSKSSDQLTEPFSEKREVDILDIFCLVNLSLKTLEYEGSDINMDNDFDEENNERNSSWKKEYLLCKDGEMLPITSKSSKNTNEGVKYTSSSSRKWHAHDCAIVMVNTCRTIVREYLSLTKACDDNSLTECSETSPVEQLSFTGNDKIIFARGITSVYLNILSLRQSDIVYVKTLVASVEIVKIFGIEHFLLAVGETLQHWMRVVLIHCGARRAKVRIEASDFLALILRLTWLNYGSFFRIRVPLLAVQTEVMERIVATAAARFYREQRRKNIPVLYLNNESAEAALTPLWRTLRRLQSGSASNNKAFKNALERLATMMKTLHKAYIAAHALAIVRRAKSITIPQTTSEDHGHMLQVSRVLTESAGFSKKILGNHGTSFYKNAVIHNEVIEDSFLAAADVFSSTELPLHRMAWLRKLAEFHSSRGKFAEEATCHFHIHTTLRQAALHQDSIWNSIPFWPWANDSSDGVHMRGDGPVDEGDIYEDLHEIDDFTPDSDIIDRNSEKMFEKNHSFRRIFYRVADSVRIQTGDWDFGVGSKTLFCGVTFVSEYVSESPWISLREIEEDMVEEAEAAGELFLKAGIIENSRFAWNLAAHFYSETYNYSKMSFVHRKLAKVVESQVPIVDTSNQLELSSPLGRFYRVYFHGGAADELMGAEFVYRTSSLVKLEEFSSTLNKVISSIYSNIDIVIDDGRSHEPTKRPQRKLLGATREAITIKITPLRPVLSQDKCPRGTTEWFQKQIEMPNFSVMNQPKSANLSYGVFEHTTIPNHRDYSTRQYITDPAGNMTKNGLVGVNKFSFTQPRDRFHGSRDLLKTPNGDISEKSLRVTQLLVAENFPNCVSRQTVLHRSVFNQSPLETSVEVVCSWCAVLFRTAVATNGLSVITENQNIQSIGPSAIKVVASCIYHSRVKDIGQMMLRKKIDEENSATTDKGFHLERLSDDEMSQESVKLARAIVIFMELVHVLIGRNRDLLLSFVESRKKREGSSISGAANHFLSTSSPGRTFGSMSMYDTYSYVSSDGKGFDDGVVSIANGLGSVGPGERVDKTMAIQRELQIAFVAMTKTLYPLLRNIIESETPRWMKFCSQEHYFSSGLYRQTRIAIGEELLYFCTGSHSSPDDASIDNFHKNSKNNMDIPLAILPTPRSDSPQPSFADSTGTSRSRLSRNSDPRVKDSPISQSTLTI